MEERRGADAGEQSHKVTGKGQKGRREEKKIREKKKNG